MEPTIGSPAGKSTLLNNEFGTTFEEMDPLVGERPKCTRGIWLERADITEHRILVMDLEGTDGKEKQDNTAFEKQSAVFALLISDVVLINMWYKDIGLHYTANRPLFETVFQAVVRLFSPCKTTLMFVIRDTHDVKYSCEMSMRGKRGSYSKISEEDWKAVQKENLKGIEDGLKEDIKKIWDSVSKPEAHQGTPFSAFYNVEVVFLPPPSDGLQFEKELARLRGKFRDSIAPGVLAGDREHVVDGSSFSRNAQLLWTEIKKNKDLDLPAHKIMVATVRCEEIAKDMFQSFEASKEWDELCEAVRTQTFSYCGKKRSEMIKNCLSKYDEKATYFNRDVKLKKREQLEEKLVQHVHPTYHRYMLQRIQSESLENFKKELEKALQGGEKFILAARRCADDSIIQFEKKYRDNFADARIDRANRDESVKVLGELWGDIAFHINTVFNQKRHKGSAAQGLIPEVSGPASNASIATLLANGVGAIASAAGNIASAVVAGAITPVVAAGVAVGVGVGVIAVGAAAGVALAFKATNKKREMQEITDYIVELCRRNQLNVELLEGSNSKCEEK